MRNDELAGVRAVICDVYGTLLKVEPGPKDGARMWESGCRGIMGDWMPLEIFNARCAAMTAELNEERRLAGEPFPDVNWLTLIRCIFGGRIPPHDPSCVQRLSNWHARCVRFCSAMPGAAEALGELRKQGVRLGIASNAQDYTRWELGVAGIPMDLFEPSLCFLSGDHGFSKPSPRVFSLLSEKLGGLGIAPHETLMIGDRFDNDIVPAQAAGWRTWHLGPRTWEELLSSMQPGSDRSV